MSKFSLNTKCPCGSRKKYKKCCLIFHKGASPKSALELMKSRYSAYAMGDSKYIIKTTHPKNSEFDTDFSRWKESIDTFCKNTEFLSLEILDANEKDDMATVTFIAHLSSGDLNEKSTFIKEDSRWYYLKGEFK